MKKTFVIAMLLVTAVTLGQKGSGFGIKGGLNYGSNGDFENEMLAIVEDPSKNVGFHVGVFARVDLGGLYVRPELVYTRTQSEYESGNLNISKLDVPVLLGLDVIGPLSVFAGPSMQYILENEFEDFSVNEAENKFTVGAQFGVGLNFERFGIDVRYERGLSDNEIRFTEIDLNRVDARPEQLIIALSVKL